MGTSFNSDRIRRFRPWPAPTNFRIVVQLQAADDRERDLFRFGGLDLALDRRVLNGAIFGCELGLGPGHPLGIDDHVGLRGISRRSDGEISDAEDHGEAGHKGDQAPLPAEEIANLQQGQRSTVGLAFHNRSILRKLAGHVHSTFLELATVSAVVYRAAKEVQRVALTGLAAVVVVLGPFVVRVVAVLAAIAIGVSVPPPPGLVVVP